MPNKHFCQGPNCHTYPTTDRFLKSRGVIRGRYAYATIDSDSTYQHWNADKYFCSQSCKLSWLSVNMENIEQGRPIEFIRHRRESGGYEKTSETINHGWGDRTYTSIKRVDNRTEID